MLNKILNRNKFNQSTVEVLPRLLSKNQLLKLSSEVNDAREVVDIALRLKLIDPTTLLKKLSKLTGYPLYQGEPKVIIDLIEELPITKLEKLGSFPILDSNKLIAIAAVDPFIAKQALRAPEGFKFFLTTYQIVSNYWNKYQTQKYQLEILEQDYQKFKNNLFNKIIDYSNQIKTYAQVVSFNNNKVFIKQKNKDMLLIGDIQEDEWNSIVKEYLREEIIKLDDGKELSCYSNQQQHIVVTYLNPPSCRKYKSKEESLPRYKIIIIDDSNVFIKVIEKNLNDLKAELVSFNNPTAAKKFINTTSTKIDLIICDLHMPDLGGDRLKSKIQNKLDDKNIPFLILSSDTDIDTKLRLYNQGIDDYISKEEDPRLIVSKIKTILIKQQKVCNALMIPELPATQIEEVPL